MPAIQSSEGDDTTASREESDTLICGFGLRRTQGDSNSLDSSDNFGIGGLNNADTELNSSLICGFGDNSSRGDIIVGVIEESISTMHHKVTDINKEVTENEVDSNKVKSSKVNVSAQNNGVPSNHFFQIPIPTKTVCNSSMSVPRMDNGQQKCKLRGRKYGIYGIGRCCCINGQYA